MPHFSLPCDESVKYSCQTMTMQKLLLLLLILIPLSFGMNAMSQADLKGKPAPAFQVDGEWFNSEAFDIDDLKGKVTMVNFWVFSCYNCYRSIDRMGELYETYKDYGFEIVGVHTPEFESDKPAENVAENIIKRNVTWPVFQDNEFRTWRAYGNRYWPAFYLVDKEGVVQYQHFGEISDVYPQGYIPLKNKLEEMLGVTEQEISMGVVTPEIAQPIQAVETTPVDTTQLRAIKDMSTTEDTVDVVLNFKIPEGIVVNRNEEVQPKIWLELPDSTSIVMDTLVGNQWAEKPDIYWDSIEPATWILDRPADLEGMSVKVKAELGLCDVKTGFCYLKDYSYTRLIDSFSDEAVEVNLRIRKEVF